MLLALLLAAGTVALAAGAALGSAGAAAAGAALVVAAMALREWILMRDGLLWTAFTVLLAVLVGWVVELLR